MKKETIDMEMKSSEVNCYLLVFHSGNNLFLCTDYLKEKKFKIQWFNRKIIRTFSWSCIFGNFCVAANSVAAMTWAFSLGFSTSFHLRKYLVKKNKTASKWKVPPRKSRRNGNDEKTKKDKKINSHLEKYYIGISRQNFNFNHRNAI